LLSLNTEKQLRQKIKRLYCQTLKKRIDYHKKHYLSEFGRIFISTNVGTIKLYDAYVCFSFKADSPVTGHLHLGYDGSMSDEPCAINILLGYLNNLKLLVTHVI
jgi:hypothetical protein